MNEELLKQLLPIAEKTKEGILKAIEIAQVECPVLIQQLLNWELARHIAYIGFSVAIFTAFGVVLRWTMKQFEEDTSEGKQMAGCATCFFTGVVSLIGIVCLADNILTIVQIWIAPKIFLLEYISELFK